jgi:hypothetical protein
MHFSSLLRATYTASDILHWFDHSNHYFPNISTISFLFPQYSLFVLTKPLADASNMAFCNTTETILYKWTRQVEERPLNGKDAVPISELRKTGMLLLRTGSYKVPNLTPWSQSSSKLYLNIQFLPRRNRSAHPFRRKLANSVQGNNRCLFWELFRTHKYTLWANAELLNVKAGGIHSDHRASKC